MPACLMAAATVNIPAISLNVGPMLNGWHHGERTGLGTIVWKARERHAAGDIDFEAVHGHRGLVGALGRPLQHDGHGLDHERSRRGPRDGRPGIGGHPGALPASAPAAYETGRRIVDMVWEDLKPSDILTREAFENAIVVNSAIGGSTNAPIHINAIAKHIGVPLTCDDWERVGFDVPLIVNMQPAGEYLGEEYHRAGGLPAVIAELIGAGRIHERDHLHGPDRRRELPRQAQWDRTVIRSFDDPLRRKAGFLNLKGTLFESAIMKTSVISKEFHDRYLADPEDPNAFEGRVVVFDGPEDYHHRIDDPSLEIDEHTILIMRGAGPIGTPAPRRS